MRNKQPDAPPWPEPEPATPAGRHRRTDLEHLELLFIAWLRTRQDPWWPGMVEQYHDLILRSESASRNPDGRNERLARIQWEIDRFHSCRGLSAELAGMIREAKAGNPLLHGDTAAPVIGANAPRP